MECHVKDRNSRILSGQAETSSTLVGRFLRVTSKPSHTYTLTHVGTHTCTLLEMCVHMCDESTTEPNFSFPFYLNGDLILLLLKGVTCLRSVSLF